METKKLKICCFMWYDDKIKNYGDINFQITKMYCDKYGYDIIKSNERRYSSRPPHWERLPLMLQNIDKYDYMIWLDADAFFYINSPPITNVINAHPDKLLFLSGDVDEPHSGHGASSIINSGFFIVKCNDESKKILTEWAYSDDLYKNRYSHLLNGVHYLYNDQGVIRLMYDKNIMCVKQKSIRLEYGILQIFPVHDPRMKPIDNSKFLTCKYGLNNAAFVCHTAPSSDEESFIISKKYFDDNVKPLLEKHNETIDNKSKSMQKTNKKIILFLSHRK